MNNLPRRPARFLGGALLCAAAALTSCSLLLGSGDVGEETNHLAPCTASGSVFATLPFDQWPTTYHDTVNGVIEAHLNALTQLNTLKLQCTASDYAGMAAPTDALARLAATLPPWKHLKSPQTLSEAEIGPVLLEYLRIYECALNERNNFISLVVQRDYQSSMSAAGVKPIPSMQRIPYNEAKAADEAVISRELTVARATLDRTLLVVGGEDRLRPLSLDIECLKRTSLDIRNILGLVSQASACLPRLRDARGSVRDLPPLSQ